MSRRPSLWGRAVTFSSFERESPKGGGRAPLLSLNPPPLALGGTVDAYCSFLGGYRCRSKFLGFGEEEEELGAFPFCNLAIVST